MVYRDRGPRTGPRVPARSTKSWSDRTAARPDAPGVSGLSGPHAIGVEAPLSLRPRLEGRVMTTEARVANALRAPEPVPVLRALVQDLAREGSTKTEIYGLLESFLVQLRTRPD